MAPAIAQHLPIIIRHPAERPYTLSTYYTYVLPTLMAHI